MGFCEFKPTLLEKSHRWLYSGQSRFDVNLQLSFSLIARHQVVNLSQEEGSVKDGVAEGSARADSGRFG